MICNTFSIPFNTYNAQCFFFFRMNISESDCKSYYFMGVQFYLGIRYIGLGNDEMYYKSSY